MMEAIIKLLINQL